MSTPREAVGRRLEQRVRAIVREELATAGGVDGPVDNSVDNPAEIDAMAGGYRGGSRPSLDSGLSLRSDNPRIRTVRMRRGGQPLSELELLHGYGLDPGAFEELDR
jgi:hypothetical protein